MTLKEKFKPFVFYIADSFNVAREKDKEKNAKQCAEIADDYAIEFAEWLYRWDNTRLPNGNWIIKLGIRPYTSKEVLEIFKKEKGL